MKIFITGSSGFIGSFLAESLVEKGHEVYCLTRSLKKFNDFSIKGTPIVGSLSIKSNNEWIKELPKDIDVIYHLAGLVHTFRVQEFYDVNAEATRILIEDLKDFNPKLKFVLMSSLAAAGPSQAHKKLTEADVEGPISHYGRSKLRAESYLKNLAPLSWTKAVVRPPIVIGPRDPAMVDVFKMVKGGVVLLSGLKGANKKYSFVAVNDLVEFCHLIAEKNDPAPWNVYFCANQTSFEFNDLVDHIKEMFDKKIIFNIPLPLFLLKGFAYIVAMAHKLFKIDLRLTPDKTKELIPHYWEVDSKKSIELLNMNYRTDFKLALKNAFMDYKERNWI